MNRINIIATYRGKSILSTIENWNNSSEIKNLAAKSAEIFPIQIKRNSKDEIATKLREMIINEGQNVDNWERVFVVWKGLFE
jgi:hypothetical protein